MENFLFFFLNGKTGETESLLDENCDYGRIGNKILPDCQAVSDFERIMKKNFRENYYDGN
ncbi:MAG: hypothetical protein JW982_09765 [Spirochaetes bacterium]|nr:hypothetical protein [Spirochaetota bacterium]